jgi:hypothetical protein
MAATPGMSPAAACKKDRTPQHLYLPVFGYVCAPSHFVEKDLYILSTSEYGLRVLSI